MGLGDGKFASTGRGEQAVPTVGVVRAFEKARRYSTRDA